MIATPLLNLLHDFGSICVFFGKVLRSFFQTRGNLSAILNQVASISIRSLPTVAFAGVFVGAILVLQFNLMLASYDAQSFLGGLNTSAVVREVGPLIISFLLAGKIGAYTAAELGTMRVTEQIDAIECLGTDPIQYLVIPRMVGIVVSSAILLMLGLIISVAGSMFVAAVACDVNPWEFAHSIPQFTSMATVLSGMIKSMVYGVIVAAVACHQGYTATGGARGVGKAVTMAAVYTNFYIVIANYFTSGFLDWVTQWINVWNGGGV